MTPSEIQAINRGIFREGNIRVSPSELQMLNNRPAVAYRPSFITSNINSDYELFLSGYAQYILAAERKHTNTSIQLEIALNQLRSLPRPVNNGFQQSATIDTRMIVTESHKVMYRIFSGQVHVYNIVTKNALAAARPRLEKPGLYKVVKDVNGCWKRKGTVSKVETEYAAINDQSNVLEKAAWLMGLHVDHAFSNNNVVKNLHYFITPVK